MKYSDMTVICGPMFAGKTTRLIDIYEEMPSFRKRDTISFKPVKDNRYSTGEIVSHDGVRIPCVTVANTAEMAHIIYERNPRMVIVDEAQFFDVSLASMLDGIVCELGIQVVCAGLDMDAHGRPFGCMPQLLAVADHVIKLQNKCELCGNPGTRTKALTSDTGVGGAEKYSPRCVLHWGH